MPDNAAAGKSLYEVWEKRDFEAIGALMADDVEFTDAGGEVHKGRAAVRDWYASWATACPDSHAGAAIIACTGDTVVAEGVYAGTNTGPLGPVSATGKSVSLPWINVLRFGSDGKIVGGAAYFDQVTLLTQLGQLQAPA